MSCKTVFDDRLARSATTREEAAACLLSFIEEGRNSKGVHSIGKHSRGYDLFLPWFMEVVEYREPYPGKLLLSIPDLQELYMDAAWDLVMKGVLRPGPKAVSGDTDPGAYGKAFSLMHREG